MVVLYVTNTTGIRETFQQCAEMKAVGGESLCPGLYITLCMHLP